MAKEFEDKVVLITGAGKGLGKAYALYLAKLGASIVVNNRRHGDDKPSSADEIVAQIVAQGGAAVADYSSVEDLQAGERMLKLALDTFGRLDAVVANAGISEGRSFHKQEIDEFRQVIDINLMGTANILHPAFCHMYEQRSGSIVVSTSVAGLYGEHGLPAYSASKAAVLGLMYSLSKEGARRGIRVNALAPFAATQMTEDQLTPELRELMRADQVAPLLAWLINDSCSLNGQTLICGGGKISRARMMETGSLAMPSDLEFDIEKMVALTGALEGLPLDQAHRAALEQFASFMGLASPES
jgi:NAD(P)-dependent dehydrogenase (short-subunit alcohol dehydrogenase family)